METEDFCDPTESLCDSFDPTSLIQVASGLGRDQTSSIFTDGDLINFPTPDLFTTIWQDVLGLPTNLNCPVISAPLPLPLCGGISPVSDVGPGADPVAVANSMKQYVKAQTLNCYNGFHQTKFGKAVQAFSALALLPVASNHKDNLLALGTEILGKLSLAAGSNSAGRVFTPVLEAFTAEVTTPLYIFGNRH